MRIAFTSCMFNRVFPQQPVWGQIAQHAPDHLVLLGDLYYLDLLGAMHPQQMEDGEFSHHVFALQRELVMQPDFAALVQSLPAHRVHAIWDDHDFLWNDAAGAGVEMRHVDKVPISAAYFEVLRDALAQGLVAGSYPAVFEDARVWDRFPHELATPSLALAPDVMLHLSDGRTHRTPSRFVSESRRTIFGTAQRGRFTQAIGAAPDALHLFASGSTLAGYSRYPQDLGWLEGLAANQRMLVLSGDIHHNRLGRVETGGFPLHEATSSGAAVRTLVVAGAEQQNFGLLDIDANTVTIRLFHRGVDEVEPRVIDRDTWQPLS
jgi:alkaline phosphatase D